MNTFHTRSFDKTWMLDQIGGDLDLLHEVAQVFLDDGPRLKDGLAQALQAADSKALHAAAHAAKSAVGNFGAKDAVSAAHALEVACKSEDKSGYPALCQTLLEAIDMLSGELRAELAAAQG